MMKIDGITPREKNCLLAVPVCVVRCYLTKKKRKDVQKILPTKLSTSGPPSVDKNNLGTAPTTAKNHPRSHR